MAVTPCAVALCAVALCAVALAACGSVTGTATSGAPATTASQAAPKISVVVEVTSAPGGKVKHWTLQCEPTGGTHPDPAAACHQLLTATRPFAPVPHGIMCPMVVTGQETATIKGTWLGTKINVRFSQLSGCASMRWRELGQVFNPIH